MAAEERILCLSGCLAGEDFIRQCAELDVRVALLTADGQRDAAWPREAIEELATMPEGLSQEQVQNTVSWMARGKKYSRIVALDENLLLSAAGLREHMRVPGMGLTTAGYYRDRLAMRISASESSFAVCDFVRVLNYQEVRAFLDRTPGPWLLRPRRDESRLQSLLIEDAGQLWRALDELGDLQSHYLLEERIEGDAFTVESIVSECAVVFAVVHKHLQPGGEASPQCVLTANRTSAEWTELATLNKGLAPALGMVRGLTHARFIRRAKDGRFFFDDLKAGVAPGLATRVAEAATGMNLWREWARMEVAHLRGYNYTPSDWHESFAGGLLWSTDAVGVAAYERASKMDLPEIVARFESEAGLGVLVRSAMQEQVNEILSWLRRN